MVKADEGKQKQHAECVDNTGATQLSKLSDINLSCAPEQDLGLKSLRPVELRQKSRHPPLCTTFPSTESEDSIVRSFRFSQTFFFFKFRIHASITVIYSVAMAFPCQQGRNLEG